MVPRSYISGKASDFSSVKQNAYNGLIITMHLNAVSKCLPLAGAQFVRERNIFIHDSKSNNN